MFDKKLIECVRKNPILYDLSHPEYMDTELKSDVWKKIGAELKVEGGTCKTRWNGIRDSYRKFLKKTVARSAQGGKPFPAYKYAKQMRFLQKFYDDKGSESLYQYCSTSFADDQISDTEEKQLNDTIIVDNSTADENVLTEEILVNESTKEEQVPTPTKQRKKNSSLCQILPKPCVEVSKELINTNSNEERASTKVMDVCHKDTEISKPVVEHPVDVFLNAMGTSLKTLSPLNWHLAKSEIFSIVQKYELRTLTGQGQVQLQVIKLHNSATPSPSTLPLMKPKESPTLPLLKPKDTPTGATGK